MIKDFFPIMFINKKANLGFPPNNLVEKINSALRYPYKP